MASQTDNVDADHNGGAAVAMEVVVYEDVDNEAFFNSLPPGYRFCPKDEELIVHYLEKKVKNQKLPPNRIRDINLYDHNPDYLAEIYLPTTEKVWYFFTPRDKKYPKGERPNRKAGDGYWKATGADKDILSNDRCVGFKKSLVFCKGKASKGDKTDWMMHEFRVKGEDSTPPISRGPNNMKLDDWVLCKIYMKPNKSRRDVPNTESQTEDVDAPIGNGENVDTPIGNGDHEESGPSNASSSFDMVYNSNDNMDDYMGLLNPSGIDESNRSLEYNLAPFPENPISSVAPISFAPAMPFTESEYQPISLVPGSTDDDWTFKQENYEIFSQFDYNFFYQNCLDPSNSAHADGLLQLPNATGTPLV